MSARPAPPAWLRTRSRGRTSFPRRTSDPVHRPPLSPLCAQAEPSWGDDAVTDKDIDSLLLDPTLHILYNNVSDDGRVAEPRNLRGRRQETQTLAHSVLEGCLWTHPLLIPSLRAPARPDVFAPAANCTRYFDTGCKGHGVCYSDDIVGDEEESKNFCRCASGWRAKRKVPSTPPLAAALARAVQAP